MTRRLHKCLTCPPADPSVKFPAIRGLTRHKSRICATCRAEGRASVAGDNILLHLSVEYGDSEVRRPDHYAGRGGW